jgi:8-oxo-dGTP diphosphatase
MAGRHQDEHQPAVPADEDVTTYPPVRVTVDVVALTIRDGALAVLLVERGIPPFEGRWALPGGFVRDEDLGDAAMRELIEETGIRAESRERQRQRVGRVHLEQLGTYGRPDRDPRMRVITVAHLAFAPAMPDPVAGTDAADAAWVPVRELGITEPRRKDGSVRQRPDVTRQLAFDHATIVADGLDRARAKLEYSPLATAFVDEEFTIAELRAVYETVWDEPLHAGNFHRKVLSVSGFVEAAGERTARGGARGGRRAQLYRAGDARWLHPPLLPPSREDDLR